MDVEALAREAGLPFYEDNGDLVNRIELTRFASLHREAVVQELVDGSGEPAIETGGTLGKQDFYTADQLAGAVARERERCAQAAEKQARWIGYNAHAEAIAAAIRGQT